MRAAKQATQDVLRAAQDACRACCSPEARKCPALGPKGPRRRKNCDISRYMREYMPENQVETTGVKTPPEPRKGVYQDAWDALEEKQAVLICLCYVLCVISYSGGVYMSLRGASHKKLTTTANRKKK